MRTLLVVALLGCGGASDNETRQAQVMQLRDAVKIDTGDLEQLREARGNLSAALAIAPDDGESLARLAEVDGLMALLYATPLESQHPFDVTPPKGDPARHDWVIGKTALELTRISGVQQLRDIHALLSELDATDPWRHWLEGRVAVLEGDREKARNMFGSGFPLAVLDRAELTAEDGRPGEAIAMLEPLLKAKRTLVLASARRAIFKAELGDIAGAVADLDDIPPDAPRLKIDRLLGNALVGIANERYGLAGDALAKLGGMRALPNECELWLRIAWAHLQLGRPGEQPGKGDHRTAAVTRSKCSTWGPGSPNPALHTVDAALQLALGNPDKAIALAEKWQLPWPQLVRAQAQLELGDAAAALTTLSAIATTADTAAHRIKSILDAQARAVVNKDKPRADALAELDGIADTAKSQRARHALGAAYYAIGDLVAAKRELRRVVEETTPEKPDPLGYRTHALLAEIALAEADLATASAEVQRATEIHPGNVAVQTLQAKILVRRGDHDQALTMLATLRKQGELHPAAQLVVAEALVSRPDVTADQRSQAKTLVTGVVGKLPAAEVGRVAALVEPGLPAKLKLPVGKLPTKRV